MSERSERSADRGSAGIHARLDRLEEAIFALGYRVESLDGRADAAVVQACRELVRAHVPRDGRVLVIAKGDPVLLDLYGRDARNFPQDAAGRYPGFPLAHSVAAIAHLEAQRLRGECFLLIPETAAWWIDQFVDFAAHLLGRYDVAADEPGAGLLVDLRARHAPDPARPQVVAELLDHLTAAAGRELAVLDWTDLDLAGLLRGRNVFAPPAGATLPYLDHSVDVVVVADPERRPEARRTAGLALVMVDPGRRPTVTAVEVMTRQPASEPRGSVRFVVGTIDPDPVWLTHLEEAVADAPGADVVVGRDLRAVAGDADVIALVEDGVVPLPGCGHAALKMLAADRVGAVAPKLLAADGSLEAAGVTVFADGSWAGVGAGSPHVVAPWHEYVRETCGAPGLIFMPAACLAKLDDQPALATGSPMTWAAALWAAGLRVLYQPDAAAVRAVTRTPDPLDEAVASAWAPALSSRPVRPELLDDQAWRVLLAGEDIEAGWR